MRENRARQARENRLENSGYLPGLPPGTPAFWLQRGKFDFLTVINNTPNTLQTTIGEDLVFHRVIFVRPRRGRRRKFPREAQVHSVGTVLRRRTRARDGTACRGRKCSRSNPGILRSRGLCSRSRLPRPETSAAVGGPGPREVVGRGSRSPSRQGGGKGPRRARVRTPCRESGRRAEISRNVTWRRWPPSGPSRVTRARL